MTNKMISDIKVDYGQIQDKFFFHFLIVEKYICHELYIFLHFYFEDC